MVPVRVDVSRSNGALVSLSTFTRPDGTFSVSYAGSSREYGHYSAAAAHPSEGKRRGKGQAEWDVLGMRARPPVAKLEGEAVNEFSSVFVNITRYIYSRLL